MEITKDGPKALQRAFEGARTGGLPGQEAYYILAALEERGFTVTRKPERGFNARVEAFRAEINDVCERHRMRVVAQEWQGRHKIGAHTGGDALGPVFFHADLAQQFNESTD